MRSMIIYFLFYYNYILYLYFAFEIGKIYIYIIRFRKLMSLQDSGISVATGSVILNRSKNYRTTLVSKEARYHETGMKSGRIGGT